MRSPGLVAAIEKKGGVSALAKELGITAQAVSQWDEVPPHKVIAIERATGVPREQLRPDLYPERENGTTDAPSQDTGHPKDEGDGDEAAPPAKASAA